MPTRGRILLVEDERDVADLMTLHLRRDGYDVTVVDNGEAALRAMQGGGFDGLVLDWMLPGLSGLELCRKIRDGEIRGSSSQIPVLMVTARAQAADIVQGLDAGADDYLTKPFELPVFIARVRALLRRSIFNTAERETRWSTGGLIVDKDTYQVSCQGKPISLTPSEFKLLVALMKQQGRVLTRERLIDLVQGEGVNVVDRAIDTHVFGLRKKLGHCSDLIETVRGIGYRVKIGD
jgi:DNA-binding response OmpR family regulator